MIDLLNALMKVPDHRVEKGRRHKLGVILLIDIIGSMAGYEGILSKNEFMKRFEKELVDFFDGYLHEKYKLPNATTIMRAKEKVKIEELNKVLYEYLVENGYAEGVEMLHIDGKAIRSTMRNENTKEQSYKALVNVFSGEFHLYSREYEQGKGTEVEEFQKIVSYLDVKNMIVTGDALHCQKKQRN
jgi:hypothetical protein